MSRTAVIAGVGPGLGESVARKFVEEGCNVGLFARSEAYLDSLEEDLGADAIAVPTDITDPEQVESGVETVRDAFGPIDVLVNHASTATWQGLRDISPEEFERSWRVSAKGAFLCSKAAVDEMLTDDGGTIIFTGATSAVRGREGAIGFSSAKFAVRGMAESMARELGPEGIHVAHVVIDGQIRPPGGLERSDRDEESVLDPDSIADSYWHLVTQDRSSWTLELDLRPHVEDF